VLTLGGYNPNFDVPSAFPTVPRLGFYFSVDSDIVVKGGCYFALTNTCVMAGGSLNATASFGPVSAWFNAYMDFLVCWDPFTYEFDIGVEIGASLSIQVCFIACATIGISISVGAQLTIEGPPFHGTASISYYVVSITISFGSTPQQPNYITDWGTFAGKYLTVGSSNSNAVSLQFNTGILAPDPPGAAPRPGTQAQPWQVGVEFSFQSTTRMPAISIQDFAIQTVAAPAPNMPQLDLAPMHELAVGSAHILGLVQLQGNAWRAPVFPNGTTAAEFFNVTPVTGFFPEATWHWVDPQNMPAGARTITAVTGFSVSAHVVFNNQSALIPISTLVADLPAFALPLPFAYTAALSGTMQAYGEQAALFAAAFTTVTSQQMLTASAGVLSGPTFKANRSAFGLLAAGIPPLAVAALLNTRSAAPAIMPITTGLTMKHVGLGLPTLEATIISQNSVLLSEPRLRAVLQLPAIAVADTPAALHTTTIGIVAAAGASGSLIPRMTPPVTVTVAGALLIRVPAPAAPRPTRAAAVPRTLRNAAGGRVIAAAHQKALDAAATDFVAGGVTLAGGAAHVWQLPKGAGALGIQGTGAVRILFGAANGATISDTEYAVSNKTSVPVPAGTVIAVVESLGNLPATAKAPAPAFGAISSTFAPAQQQAAVGWQAGSTLFQVGPTRLMARGASLRLPGNFASRTLGQTSSFGTAVASDVMAGQAGVETQLPANITVVMIALDLADATAAATADDLAISLSGATLFVPPMRVSSANRRLLLYDVAKDSTGTGPITVSVASTVSWNIAGVIGVPGSAQEWATQLAAGIPNCFIPRGPITPDGSLTVTWTPPATEGTA